MKKSFIVMLPILSAFQLFSCDSSVSSIDSENSEVLMQIGKNMMETSIDKASQTSVKAMLPVDIKSYANDFIFPGVMVYWAGLLEKHPDFDCSDKIMKFEYKVSYPESQPRTLGTQINLLIDRDNDQIILRATQGENADDFKAGIGVKINYDFKRKTIRDYLFCRVNLDESHTITDGIIYSKNAKSFARGSYTDEDCSAITDDIMNPFIEMIPNAILVEGKQARTYMSDYCDAGDYYASIGGSGVIKTTLVD